MVRVFLAPTQTTWLMVGVTFMVSPAWTQELAAAVFEQVGKSCFGCLAAARKMLGRPHILSELHIPH